MENRELEKHRSLRSLDEQFTYEYSLRDYIQNEYDEEWKQIQGELKLPEVQLPDKKSYNQWRKIPEPIQIQSALFALEAQTEESPEGKTVAAEYFRIALYTARHLLLSKTLEQRKKIAEQYGLAFLSESDIQLVQFAEFGDINVKIKGISIKDAVNNPNLPAPSAYGFFMGALDVDKNVDIDGTVLDENETPLTIKYPNVTKKAIHSAATIITSMANMNEEGFDIYVRLFLNNLPPPGIERDLILTARETVKRIARIKQNIHETIFNPSSPDFASLKNIVEKYLSEGDNGMQARAILHLGINNYDEISHSYRKAKELAQLNDENSSFYESLADKIRVFSEEVPTPKALLTKDDLPSLIDADISLDNADIPTLEDLRKQALPLSQKPLKPEYSIDPQDIDWKNLIPPTSVGIIFLGTPNKFGMIIHYQSEDGEVLDIPISFDTKKGQFNWRFMEAPDDPDMQDMKDAVLLAAKSILLDVQQQTEAEYQQKQEDKQARMQPQQPAQGRKVRSEEPYVPREKEPRAQRSRPLTPIQEVLEGQFTLPVREKVKKYISLPEEENIRSMMEGVSAENQNRIIAGINRFNEKGTGKFKPLEVIRHDGKPVWELRVGNFRALVTRADPTADDATNRRDTFGIYEIGERKNIFKKKS